MAVREPTTYEEALVRISELESLDALLLREHAASDNGGRHNLRDVARELGAEDLLDR